MPPSSLIIPKDLPQEVVSWRRADVQKFLKANKDKYYIEDDDIKTLEQQKVTGRTLPGLTLKKLEDCGLVEGAAELIMIIVEELKAVKGLTRKRPHEEISEEGSGEDSYHAKRQKVLEEGQKEVVDHVQQVSGPSTLAQVSQFKKEQARSPMLNGRYPDPDNPLFGLPVSLYHEAFTVFQAHLEAQPNAAKYPAIFELQNAAGVIYSTKGERLEAVRPLLQTVLDTGIAEEAFHGSRSDGVVSTWVSGCQTLAYCAMLEVKNEIGTGHCDPSIQAQFSYRAYWSQMRNAKIRGLCCCPSFILAMAGSYFCVLGAVFLDKIIVQPLTEYICLSPYPEEKQSYYIAQVFTALSEGISALNKFYRSLPSDSGTTLRQRRFDPYIRSYICNVTKQEQTFEYLGRLVGNQSNSTKAIFKAETDEPDKRLIVVKFVERYNVAAHLLLAKNGLAPKLLYPPSDDQMRRVGTRSMIVMEYVDGQNAALEYGYRQLPESILKEIKRALDILHGENWVFGDLRPPNIMIRNGQPLLVDFDWCAREGEGTYPINLNHLTVKWAKGVAGCGLMQKEHDIDMWRELCRGAL
ncbi:hypothetical protein FRC03_008030 [Tulasnella sp. 419]|nr:hypothetical protein FRC03_008030 [Tulasnella sp. 419]